MGINLGAFFGPLITGFLAQDARFRAHLAGWGFDPNATWHWGFGAAGVGMTFGLVQYVLGGRALGTAGPAPVSPGRRPADAKFTPGAPGSALGDRRCCSSRLGVAMARRAAVAAAHG